MSWLGTALGVPVSEVPGRQHLRSAELSVPRVRRSTFGTRAFSVAGPTVWNSLPDHLRDPAVDSEQFRWDLKTYLQFAERCYVIALYNSTFTYLLIYEILRGQLIRAYSVF